MDLGLTFTVKEDYVPLHKIITKKRKYMEKLKPLPRKFISGK